MAADRVLTVPHGMTRWGRLPAGLRDLAVALVLAASSFVPPLSEIGARLGGLDTGGPPVVGVLLVLGQTLPLAVRTRCPALALGVIGAAFAFHQTLGYPPTLGSIGLYAALYSVGAHPVYLRRVVLGAATAAYAVLGVVLSRLGSPNGAPDILVFYLALTAVYALGVLVRERRAHDAERRRSAERAAAAEERHRLAAELHDVVTHHVTAMVVQAGAARHLPEMSTRVDDALATIDDSGRRALTELRSLLGVLEATGEDATPGTAPAGISAPGDVTELVERVRAGGQPVELVRRGEEPEMGAASLLTLYRTVQESLTNVVKHSPGRPTTVHLTYSPCWADVHVITGPSTSGAVADGVSAPRGRGLAGMRERVETVGGDFTAGPHGDGGFRVHARIPARGDT
ncbi:two-component sensor histidine kinase [Phycicoccus sp. CSK15P-2]|uniref:sensor histidine kinase n=1 Tax=Phycicoccus sp. CSK15P-2 TaxID=2807627 RepID=UPI001950EB75|nr:sensor histidine kinase [Phycicoccus sp. CSK15P-2]MBM6404483.1 two-component sensor histidine kinase [Phycicoccus sp. CSK15P-2]